MESFARTIDAAKKAKKYVVSSTLDRVDWNARPRGPIRTDVPKDAYSTNGNRVVLA